MNAGASTFQTFIKIFIFSNLMNITQTTILRNSNKARARWMDFSGKFLSQQNTHSPQSFHCSSSFLWFSWQRTSTLRSSRNLFPRPTTEAYYYQTSERIHCCTELNPTGVLVANTPATRSM